MFGLSACGVVRSVIILMTASDCIPRFNLLPEPKVAVGILASGTGILLTVFAYSS
jgi:hypothetical protein